MNIVGLQKDLIVSAQNGDFSSFVPEDENHKISVKIEIYEHLHSENSTGFYKMNQMNIPIYSSCINAY